jgi:predicted short-subunit dehydrogenase-like oxidoreductase (DUF2520 family)
MRPIATRDRSRALYHAAAVLAAGSQVALFAEAVRAFRKATGASEPEARAALLPLALGALEKLRAHPPAAALTGPAVRGDLETISAHRKALPKDLLSLYDQLTSVMLKLRTARSLRPEARGPAVTARGPASKRRALKSSRRHRPRHRP